LPTTFGNRYGERQEKEGDTGYARGLQKGREVFKRFLIVGLIYAPGASEEEDLERLGKQVMEGFGTAISGFSVKE